jgi:hypothetical protein
MLFGVVPVAIKLTLDDEAHLFRQAAMTVAAIAFSASYTSSGTLRMLKELS